MACIGHIAVGMAAGRRLAGFPWRAVDVRRAMVALSLLSLLPDADAIAFRFGASYSATFGHR